MENKGLVDCGGQTSSSQNSSDFKPSAIIVEDGRVVDAGVSSRSSSAAIANHCGELENDVNRLLEVVHGCITGKGLMHSVFRHSNVTGEGEPDAGGARARPPEQARPEATADSAAAASAPAANTISTPQHHYDQPPGYEETSPVLYRGLIPQDPPEQEEVVDRSGFLGPWYAIERLCSDLSNRADASAKPDPGRAPPSGAKRHQRSCKCDKRRLQAERELGSVANLLPLDGGICRHSELPDDILLDDPSCNCHHCVGGKVMCRVPVNGGSFGESDTEERSENCSLNIVN